MSTVLLPDEQSRFWAKVRQREDGCTVWTAAVTSRGYGCFRLARTNETYLAHRLAWELERGPVPAELTLDHLCGHPLCVNTSHLEIATRRVNVWRGQGRRWLDDVSGIILRIAAYPAVDGLVPVRHAGPLLGVGHQSIRRAVYSGELPGVKRGAQTRQVRQTDLIAFVVARAVEDAGLPVAEALCAQIQDLAA
jgi:hypothetical protein